MNVNTRRKKIENILAISMQLVSILLEAINVFVAMVTRVTDIDAHPFQVYIFPTNNLGIFFNFRKLTLKN